MRTEALLLLKDNQAAQRLAATWNEDLAGIDDDRTRYRKWSEAAGVTLADARAHGAPLIKAGICRPDGDLAPAARQYLQKVIAKDLGL